MLGYQRLGELRERLRPILLRRTRDSVLRELPPRTDELIRIPATDEQAELHYTHMRIVVQIVQKPFINEMDMLRLRRALLMCRLAANSTALVDKQHPGYSTKLQTLDELLQQLLGEPDRKIALFSEWTSMLDLIEPLVKKHQADYVRLDGDVPQRARSALVQRFQTEPQCRLFLTTNAGSTGLNLQAADTVINVDLPWNPAMLEQRIARAHRMGQTNPVQVYILVTEGTLEESLLATLSAKQDLALAALDAESEVDEVRMTRSSEELKRRLERLLGAKPAEPVDESQQQEERHKAQRLLAGLPATKRQTIAGEFSAGIVSTGASASDNHPVTPSAPDSLAQSGGVLISAALDFLSQLLPPQPSSPEASAIAENVAARLRQSVDRDESGRPRFTLTLPDDTTLEKIAATVAALLTRK